MSALLSLRNIWVEYGDKVVLEKVNLEVAEGAFLSIIGPSGAGKSSLLRLILGQEAPTRGTILLDGQPLAPEALLDDGLLDIVALRTFPASAAAQVVAELRAGDGQGDYVTRMRVPWIEVVAPAPIPANLDGEPLHGTDFRFSCEPGCLHLVLPADCPCVSGHR